MVELNAQLDDNDKTFMLHLFKNYYSLVRKTIYNMIYSKKNLEDLINDVFIKLIEKISLIRTLECCKLNSYIVYTSRSISINYIKHQKVENKHVYLHKNMDFIEDSFNSVEKTENKLIQQEENEFLYNAISKLPRNQRNLLYFKYILEMNDKKIAKILGIAPNSVRQYLTRARRNAKEFIEKGKK